MTEQNQPPPKGPLSPRQADLLLEHLAAGVADGVPLVELFRALADDMTDSRLRRFAAHLSARLEQGIDLPTALTAMRSLLPEHMRQALLLGLASGNLPAVMSGLAKSERSRNQMRRGLLAVFAYPLLALGMLLLLLLFMTLVVIPGFEGFFLDFEMELPALTQMVFALPVILPVILAFLLAIGLTSLAIGWMPLGKRLVHRLRTAVPLLAVGRTT
jgi:type II secretory pathway component PulF